MGGGKEPSTDSKLGTLIKDTFGSMDDLKYKLRCHSLSIQASGWSWLTYNKNTESLEILKTSNHDRPDTDVNIPLLNFDMFEHSYYIDYQNDRRAYLDSIWKIVNWNVVEKRYRAAI